MADPLSISGSIAGLVSLADIVFSRTYKYVRAVSNASKDIVKIFSEISDLYGILVRLRLMCDQLNDDPFEWTARIHLFHSCHKTLEKLRSTLDRDDATSLQDQPFEKIKRKLRWPFTSVEVKELVKELSEHKSTLGLALNVDSKLALLRVLSKQDVLNEGILDIKKELILRRETETRIHIDGARRKVLDSFCSIDPRRNLDMSRKLRHPNTGLWMIESPEFRHCLSSDQARLCLHGIPGAGKTVLTSLIIDEILQKSSPSTAIAYFFCDYKNAATQEPHKILGCLVQQIARQDMQSFEKLRNFYDNHGQGRTDTAQYDPVALCQLFQDMTSGFDATMIVVDGLDECGNSSGYVTELLASLGKSEASAIKTLLLSREELDIQECLGDYVAISIAARNSDLRIYVDAELENRIHKKKLNIKAPGLKEYIRQRLIDGAEGM